MPKFIRISNNNKFQKLAQAPKEFPFHELSNYQIEYIDEGIQKIYHLTNNLIRNLWQHTKTHPHHGNIAHILIGAMLPIIRYSEIVKHIPGMLRNKYQGNYRQDNAPDSISGAIYLRKIDEALIDLDKDLQNILDWGSEGDPSVEDRNEYLEEYSEEDLELPGEYRRQIEDIRSIIFQCRRTYAVAAQPYYDELKKYYQKHYDQ